MIPQMEVDINTQNAEEIVQPSRTYRMDLTNKRIIGETNGLDAYRISAEKLLRTQRYAHGIYDGDYGTDLLQFVGQDFEYVRAAVQQEIHESLSVDDRYQGVSDFIITKTGLDSCKIEFNIMSTEGIVPMQLELEI